MNESLKPLMAVNAGLLLLMTIAGIFGADLQLGASIFIGGVVMIANVALLRWAWSRLFAKKSIAWTAMIIVIKYAVLLGSLFLLVRTRWFSPLGAALGISSFVLAILVIAFVHYKKEKLREKLG